MHARVVSRLLDRPRHRWYSLNDQGAPVAVEGSQLLSHDREVADKRISFLLVILTRYLRGPHSLRGERPPTAKCPTGPFVPVTLGRLEEKVSAPAAVTHLWGGAGQVDGQAIVATAGFREADELEYDNCSVSERWLFMRHFGFGGTKCDRRPRADRSRNVILISREAGRGKWAKT